MTAHQNDFTGNIGAREQKKRRIMGYVALAIAASLAFVLIVMGAPRLLRLIIFFPVWLANLGFLQAREKT